MLHLQGDGVMLAAEAFGDPKAPPILFFHGGGQSRSAWRASARTAADHGYYGVTVDLRGHGDSGWAEDGDYLLDAYGRDVERLVAGFAARSRWSAHRAADKRRWWEAPVAGAAVRLIMLADVAPALDDSGVDQIRAFFRASDNGFATPQEAAQVLHDILGQPLHPEPARLEKSMRRGGDGRLFWRWDPKTPAPEMLHPPSEGESLHAAAARVKCPVVMVRAEHSNIVKPESVAVFRALTPQLEVIEAKNVGHMFTLDRNDAFAQTLLETLQRIPEKAAA